MSSMNDEEDNSLDNPIQKDFNNKTTFLHVLGVIICLCFGIYMFITFLPIKFTSEKLWITFSDTCCKIYYGNLRCLMNFTCRGVFSQWIFSQNITRNFYHECCYFYAPYNEYRFFSRLYCDPSCINAKYLS